MAKVTDAAVVGPIAADCYGNNCAVLCPKCRVWPVLLVALPNKKGSDAAHPAKCGNCGASVWMVSDTSDGSEVTEVRIAVG